MRGAAWWCFQSFRLPGILRAICSRKQSFLDRTEQHLEQLARDAADLKLAIICGTVTRTGSSSGNPIYNSAAVLEGGERRVPAE